MNDRNVEIKQANRKALPKFILFTIVCALVGFAVGFGAAWLGLEQLTDTLVMLGRGFSRYAAPWLLVLCAVLRPVICIPMYRSAKRQLTGWDGEDEAALETIDCTLTRAQWVSTLFNVIIYFLFGAVASIGVFAVKDLGGFLFVLSLLAFFVGLFEGLMLERRMVDIAKQIFPEKDGSVYDFNFQKKWLNSCDEAEKIMIGQCAYKAYQASNTACMILWIIFVLSAMFFDTGLLPVLVVCIIWGVSVSVYTHWSMKLSKMGRIEL